MQIQYATILAITDTIKANASSNIAHLLSAGKGHGFSIMPEKYLSVNIIWDMPALMAFAYLVIGATVLSYSLFLVGLKVVGSTKASLISCAEPLASIIAVVVWLKTPLTLMDLIGMACIIITVILLSIPKK